MTQNDFASAGTPSSTNARSSRPIRVLVVDDSVYMRHTINNRLLDVPDIQVIDHARDGEEALAKIKLHHPDIVTLDVEMPRLDGLSTLRRIMAEAPSRVIMLSALTAEGATATIEALRLGALDFVAKPGGLASLHIMDVRDELLSKIRRLAFVDVASLAPAQGGALPAMPRSPRTKVERSMARKLLIIGSSTGGPKALCDVVPLLPADLDAAVLIVQHMPAGFTKSLAQRLDSLAGLIVKEAQDGDPLRTGLALVAPGDFHLLVGEDGQVVLSQSERVHGVRPSIDHTLISGVRRFGARVVAVVLTGMGADGRTGALALKRAGGRVIVEDESTATIFGMPKAVIDAGAADYVLPRAQVASKAARLVRQLN